MTRLDKGQPLLESLGNAVAKRRAELGLSQEDLAVRAGVHRTYISDVERGVRNISVLTLERIASAMDIPMGVLFMFGPAVMNKQRG